MIISVASGKGGTGKTGVIGSFASLAKGKVLIDGDVEYSRNGVSRKIQTLWETIAQSLKK